MNRTLIAGIGNVLLGDDGIGPYVVGLLESHLDFGEGVEVADLGTPSLDLTHRIMGLDLLVLIDAVAADGPAGAVVCLNKAELMSEGCDQRVDPHSPALSECMLAAEMLGAAPRQVLFVGIVGQTYEPGTPISDGVIGSCDEVMRIVLQKLEQHGIEYGRRPDPEPIQPWWSAPAPHPA